MPLDAVSLRAGTKSHRKEVNRGMLKELQRFSADERGQGSELIVAIVVAVILIILVVGIYNGLLGPALQGAAQRIVDCIQCAMDPTCTSCS
jgi:hypothetical protein